MELIAIVTGLALLQVFVFAFQVGKKREEHGINAPATSGHPDFERMFRVHQNSIEQIVIFVPGLWMFGFYVNAQIGAGIGLLFVIARQIYRNAYLGDPKNRGKGFGFGALCMVVLLLGGMIGAGMSFF
jgi:glutathione S-transferase